MTRPALPDYAGAGDRLDPERALRLPAGRWGWQPKVDGCYAQISTDGHGRIWSVVSRSGAELREGADLHGIVAGPPHTVLVGELEAHTEAGVRAAETRGWRVAHLFDCLRWDGRVVTGLPYAERRGCLYRAASWVEGERMQRDDPHATDDRGRDHDAAGRYVRHVPRDLRRLPIVPMARGHVEAAAMWRSVVEVGGGEGLVAVRLDAPVGKRGAKRKIKVADTLDATVLATDGRAMRVAWRGHAWVMSGTARPGSVVEVRHDGWYESGTVPRFPRMVRSRDDLSCGGATIAQ